MRYRKLLLLGILLFLSSRVFALQVQSFDDRENPRYVFETWDNTDGLPTNSISSIKQSREGYVWFSSAEGLVRFDGDRFEVYNSVNTPEIKEKLFETLAIGIDGSLWTANKGGIINVRRDGFLQFNRPEGSEDYQVNSIIQGADTKVYLGTIGNGLEVLDEQRAVTSYQTDGEPSGNMIFTLEFDQDSTLWLGTGNGLSRFKDNNIEAFTEFDELHGVEIRTLLADSENQLWAGTHQHGVYKIDGSKITRYSSENGLSGDMVVSLFEDDSGSIWVGTNGNGLNKITPQGIDHYTAEEELPGNTIFSIFQSRDGSYWAAIAGAGLTRFRKSKIFPITQEQGLSSNIILPIYQHQDGTVWVGTAGDGLNRIDANGNITTYTTDSGLTHNLILSIYGEPDGTIWAGTLGGLNKIKNGSITTITSSDELNFDIVNALLLDSSGKLWIAGPPGHLQYIDDGEFKTFNVPDSFQNAHLTSLLEDSKNNLWIGSLGGGLLKITKDDTTHYTTDNGLSNETILDVTEGQNGVIWIGTHEGLNRYENGVIESFTTQHGLQGNIFYRLLQDQQGFLWSCSNSGIQAISLHSVELFRNQKTDRVQSHLLTTKDGMPNNECNGAISPAGWIMENNHLWFPTVGGIATFNPNEIDFDTTPPDVLIENLVLGDHVYSGNEAINLEPGSHSFEIKYTALEFQNPDLIQFQFRLENLDNAWIDAGSRRTAYFTGLPPGNYKFEVIASKAGGEWNSVSAELPFVIEPFFYQTRPFLALLFLALFFTGFGVQRVWRFKTDQERLQELVNQRTNELKQEVKQHEHTEKELEKSLSEKIVLLKEIHHRVKNNLAVINALFELQVHKTDNQEAINLLLDSQHRIKTIAMIHEHLYQTEFFSSLKMDDYIKKLAQIIHKSFKSEEKQITHRFDLDPVELSVNQAIPCGLILNELITNTYKHVFSKQDTGEIFIRISRNMDMITIEVKDNGKKSVDADRILQSDSTGITLIQTLVSQLHGTITARQQDGMNYFIEFELEEID